MFLYLTVSDRTTTGGRAERSDTQLEVTLHQAIAEATALISEQADLRDNARRDAELLLLHVIGASRTVLFTDGNLPIDAAKMAVYRDLVERRAAGEPIQYILGEQEFYGLPLWVTPAVLIPRPETELLVEAALARLPADRPLRLVDVGTGSGAIAIVIARHLPLARMTALDISPTALEVARANATRHDLAGRIRFVESDLLGALDGTDRIDAVLSNPPYVPEADRSTLHRQVRDHEPASALFAGSDGLNLYRRLIPQAAAAIKPGGLLAMEIGYGQRQAVTGLLQGWEAVQVLNDLQGISRVIVARTGK